MILKNLIFKKFNIKILQNNHIINIILFTKKLTTLYVVCYIQFLSNIQILFINNLNNLNSNLKFIKLITGSSYINNKISSTFISNYQILKNQILLLKWLVYLINLINQNKIQLPINNLIKIFTKFLKLKKNYWSIINLKNPKYIFILTPNFKINLISTYKKLNKQIYIITLPGLNHFFTNTHSIIISPNIFCIKLFLELILTSYIQSKY